MRFAHLPLTCALLVSSVFAKPPAPIVPASTGPAEAASDQEILLAPKEFHEFVMRTTQRYQGYRMKTRALVAAVFARPQDGGLGLVYSNDQTRTVAEVWRDRKANCISLTAFYVAAFRMLGIDVRFADSRDISQWVRKGSMIYLERHLVAFMPISPVDTMVADFNPEPRSGLHHLVPITEAHFGALFHSNRAVELLVSGDSDGAIKEAKISLAEDPDSAIGWNILGVIQKDLGQSGGAEACFRKAMEVDPTDGIPCGNLEELLREQGKVSEADKLRTLTLKLRDQDPYFHAFMAKDALDQGKNDQALEEIQRALHIQRMEPDFYLIQAQAQLNRGERAAATKSIEKAIHWSLPDQRKRMESKLELIQNQT